MYIVFAGERDDIDQLLEKNEEDYQVNNLSSFLHCYYM